MLLTFSMALAVPVSSVAAGAAMSVPETQEVKGQDMLLRIEEKVRKYEKRQKEKYYRFLQKESRKERVRRIPQDDKGLSSKRSSSSEGKTAGKGTEVRQYVTSSSARMPEVSVENRRNSLLGNRRFISFDVMVPASLIKSGSVMSLVLTPSKDGISVAGSPCAKWSYPLDKIKVSASDSLKVLTFSNVITLEDESKTYLIKALMDISKGNKIYYRDTAVVASSRISAPLRLLRMPVTDYVPDPEDYRPQPVKQLRNTVRSFSCRFESGASSLDAASRSALPELSADFSSIPASGSGQIKTVRISVACPEKASAADMDLVRSRMKSARELVYSMLPESGRNRIYIQTKENRLPDGDPSLGTMALEYTYESLRALTPDEIMAKYRAETGNPDIRNTYGNDEFWYLFSVVKDSTELYDLYSRAYKESMAKEGRPWLLAAANLAASDLQRGIADTSVLSPLIDDRKPACYTQYRPDGSVRDIVNAEEAVALQIMTFLRLHNYKRATDLLKILPDTQDNSLLRAIVLCHGDDSRPSSYAGYRIDTDMMDKISQAYPVNRVVFYLAMESRAFDRMAEQILLSLPSDDPLVLYLLTIVRCRQASVVESEGNSISADNLRSVAAELLSGCFEADESFVGLARNDGDIPLHVYQLAASSI